MSLITPTWKRHKTLTERTMPSVAAQTYRDFEHIIVSDGPDDELEELLNPLPENTRLVFLEEHNPKEQWGVSARIYGETIAQGELIAPLDDDDSIRPNHLELLVKAIEETGAGFAYSHMMQHMSDTGAYIVGKAPPVYGEIGVSFVYRRELSKIATWRSDRESIDWDLVKRWLRSDVKWVFVPEVTVDGYPTAFWSNVDLHSGR